MGAQFFKGKFTSVGYQPARRMLHRRVELSPLKKLAVEIWHCSTGLGELSGTCKKKKSPVNFVLLLDLKHLSLPLLEPLQHTCIGGHEMLSGTWSGRKEKVLG